MRRRRFIFVSPRVLPRSGLLPGVCADMGFVRQRGSLRRTCIPLMYAEMPSGQQVTVVPRPWVGTTPWYQPTANEDIAPPAHHMPSGHIRHSLKLIMYTDFRWREALHFITQIMRGLSHAHSRCIEEIGTYNPLTQPATITVDAEKAQNWIKNGAQPTDTVRGLLKSAGVL